MSKFTTPLEILTLNPVTDKPYVKADVGILLDKRWRIQGIQVVKGKNGLFVAWPSWREAPDKNSDRFPIFHVESESDRWAIDIRILEAYRELCLAQVEADAREEVVPE